MQYENIKALQKKVHKEHRVDLLQRGILKFMGHFALHKEHRVDLLQQGILEFMGHLELALISDFL